MQYLIRNINLHTYYARKLDDKYHFVQDKENAYIFKNKWEANRKLKELGSNFEIVRK